MQYITINDVDHLWTARERAEFRRQEGNDAKYPEYERESRRRNAAPATRRGASRPAQWHTRPDHVQETAMDVDFAQLLPEFDAVYALTSRDRVVIKRMIVYLARERQNVFVEMEELETYISGPTDNEGIIGVFAWCACDHEQRTKFAVKRKKTTLVTNVKQYEVMRAMQDEEYQELHKIIKYKNERQEKLLAMMEREALEDLLKKILEIWDFDERLPLEET